jgi:hypothetical protein
MEDMNTWGLEDDAPAPSLNLKEMDELVHRYRVLRDDYDRGKEELSKRWKLVEEVQGKIVAQLTEAGKSKYVAEGVGTFSIVNKLTITTPKTIEDKRMLFGYIKETHGEDYLDSVLSINHNTLGSFYRAEVEKAADPSLFTIPGLGEPVVRQEPRFRKG